ncbi:MAG: hypothetical protein ACHRHE_15145 [Tepidisphaerales bacterium]
MAPISGPISSSFPLAFLPSGGQWAVIALIGAMLFGKRLLQVARLAWEELGDGDPFATSHRVAAFAAFCMFAVDCWLGIVELGSGHSGNGWTSLRAAGFALALVLMLNRNSGPD